MNNSSFFESTFLYVYVILVIVEFCAFLLLWRLNWRAWWQFFLLGVALACCAPFVYHIVDVVFFRQTVDFMTRWDPHSETLLWLFIFAVWAGLEMLLIRWFCGITSADLTEETPLKSDTMKISSKNYFPASVKNPLKRLVFAVLITPIAGGLVAVLLMAIVLSW